MTDKYKSLKQEAWQQIKYAIIIFLALFGILCLGYFTVYLKNVSFWVGVFFATVAMLFSLAWAIVILFIIRENKITHFRTWGDEWQEQAQKALEFLQKEKIWKKNIIITPQKYFDILSETNRTPKGFRNISNIRFMGSMVGFFCLLPLPLRNHICETSGHITIDIIGTTKELSSVIFDRLAIYPVAFVAKTMVTLLDLCDKFKKKSQTITFNIYHFPYDITEALFIIGNEKLANLQSLSPGNIELVFGEEHLGVIVPADSPCGQFNRYSDVFDDIRKDLEKSCRKETWELIAQNGEISLRIRGKGCWSINNGRITFNDTLVDISPIDENGNNAISFLHTLYDNKEGIYRFGGNPNTLLKSYCTKLHEIDKILREKPFLSKVPCSCKWNEY